MDTTEENNQFGNCQGMKKIISNSFVFNSKSNNSQSQDNQQQEINCKQPSENGEQGIGDLIEGQKDPFFFGLLKKMSDGFRKREYYVQKYRIYPQLPDNLQFQEVIQIIDNWYESIIKEYNLEDHLNPLHYPFSGFFKVSPKIEDFDEYFLKFLIINHFVSQNSRNKKYYGVEDLLEYIGVKKDENKIQEYKHNANIILVIHYYRLCHILKEIEENHIK